jgi:integrase/recombinase XerD
MNELNNEFKKWLQTLGFADSSVKSFPLYSNEFVLFLIDKGIQTPKEITTELIKVYFFQWKNRKNKRTGGGLSENHISKGATVLNNFIKFLNTTGRCSISYKIERQMVTYKVPTVLTIDEIRAIYEATFTNTRPVNTAAYGQRDRAMLAVYYGCGLRRNEGVNLLLSDILHDKKLIHVRKGKNSKERFVPIAEKGLQDIQEYLAYGRKWFLKELHSNRYSLTKIVAPTEYFFINMEAQPMKDFGQRIAQLKEDAGISKRVSLHTFRHSIATHLMQQGMDIEQIKKFLGHSSLDSTQIYTHIINEL